MLVVEAAVAVKAVGVARGVVTLTSLEKSEFAPELDALTL
jgi:hypothetical protein